MNAYLCTFDSQSRIVSLCYFATGIKKKSISKKCSSAKLIPARNASLHWRKKKSFYKVFGCKRNFCFTSLKLQIHCVLVGGLHLVFPTDVGQVEHSVFLRSRIRNVFPGLRVVLWGHIHEYLTDTGPAAPWAVLSTAFPPKVASPHCTVLSASSPMQGTTFPLCTVFLCATLPFHTPCTPLSHSQCHPHLACTSPQCSHNSPAPQRQPQLRASVTLAAPGCPLVCPGLR